MFPTIGSLNNRRNTKDSIDYLLLSSNDRGGKKSRENDVNLAFSNRNRRSTNLTDWFIQQSGGGINTGSEFFQKHEHQHQQQHANQHFTSIGNEAANDFNYVATFFCLFLIEK